MAFTHIKFNDQLNHGRMLRRALQQLEEGRDGLVDLFSTFTTMLDGGDGSNVANFNEAVTLFGFPDNVTAKEAYDEINGLLAKINTDNPVSNTKSNLDQIFNEFR
jgi:hypothetical protein